MNSEEGGVQEESVKKEAFHKLSSTVRIWSFSGPYFAGYFAHFANAEKHGPERFQIQAHFSRSHWLRSHFEIF